MRIENLTEEIHFLNFLSNSSISYQTHITLANKRGYELPHLFYVIQVHLHLLIIFSSCLIAFGVCLCLLVLGPPHYFANLILLF